MNPYFFLQKQRGNKVIRKKYLEFLIPLSQNVIEMQIDHRSFPVTTWLGAPLENHV